MKISILILVLAIVGCTKGFPDTSSVSASNIQRPDSLRPIVDSDHQSYADALEQETASFDDAVPDQQQFYPSFAPFQVPPLGHSRPYYSNQETAFSHRSNAYANNHNFDNVARYTGFKDDSSAGLLGSGNFGVLKGGTFYGEDDKFANFYQNGHGRPYFGSGSNTRPKYQSFENFRDFADINVPTNPAYSHYVVVYANKNKDDDHPQPKNIQQLLDEDDIQSNEKLKLSKTKLKLKKIKVKKTVLSSNKDSKLEPLLALS